MRDLLGLDLIKGEVMDYGCGRGTDTRVLKLKKFKCDSFDPHWQPKIDKTKRYDTIICVFVLNVIESEHERARVCRSIYSLLKPGGRAYVAVRRDLRKPDGYTSIGTWQGTVDVPGADLMFEKKGQYALFTFGKDRYL